MEKASIEAIQDEKTSTGALQDEQPCFNAGCIPIEISSPRFSIFNDVKLSDMVKENRGPGPRVVNVCCYLFVFGSYSVRLP
jgi:hypothetical protein